MRARDGGIAVLGHQRSALDKITAQGSLRRLAALLLAVIIVFGFVTSHVVAGWLTLPVAPGGLRGALQDVPNFDKQAARTLRNLIVVTGHSVLAQDSLRGVERRDESWMLLDYQRNSGMPVAFVSHIREGVRLAALDEKALLVFSGGQTRRDAGQRSEAASYMEVADFLGWWGTESGRAVRARSLLEEFATDSFENLLFSICRFREATGAYPAQVTVISFSFKEERFTQLHRAALHFPEANFHFVGVDPIHSEAFQAKLDELRRWEHRASVKPYETDPYGCNSPILQAKRHERNPFARYPPYPLTCPELAPLLSWCNRELYPRGRLPWDRAPPSRP